MPLPLLATRHSPSPQPRSLRGFIVVVVAVVFVIDTDVITVFPPSPVIYLIVVFVLSSCPLPFLIWWWPSCPLHPPSSSLSSSSSSLSSYYPPLPVIYLIVMCMSSSLAVSSPRSPPAPSLHVILLIVDLIRCRQWCRHRHRGRCVGSSSAATAAKDDRIEVDDGVKLLLLSALPPPSWRQIEGQRHAAKVPRLSPLL